MFNKETMAYENISISTTGVLSGADNNLDIMSQEAEGLNKELRWKEEPGEVQLLQQSPVCSCQIDELLSSYFHKYLLFITK